MLDIKNDLVTLCVLYYYHFLYIYHSFSEKKDITFETNYTVDLPKTVNQLLRDQNSQSTFARPKPHSRLTGDVEGGGCLKATGNIKRTNTCAWVVKTETLRLNNQAV